MNDLTITWQQRMISGAKKSFENLTGPKAVVVGGIIIAFAWVTTHAVDNHYQFKFTSQKRTIEVGPSEENRSAA